ncbi:MAG: alpha/beta fold hydrolase [Gemmatimonadota bacterium]
MRLWTKAALAASAVAYGKTILRRNRSLVPPPVLWADRTPLPGGELELSDGERVAYVDAGEGTPILWVPGADGVKETWRFQLPLFAARYRTVAPDLRRRITPTHTFDRLTEDLAELMDRLETGPVVLVGQSLGGAIALRFAYRFPERVRALVVCNSLARVAYDHVGLNRTALVPLAIGTTRYLPTSLAAAAAAVWSRLAVWIYDDSPGRARLVEYALWTGPRTVPASVSTARVNLLKGRDLRPELSSISAPTLVVKGSEDSYCPAEWSLEIAAGIPGARYVPMPRGGHCAHISMSEEFNRILSSWLDKLSASPGSVPTNEAGSA